VNLAYTGEVPVKVPGVFQNLLAFLCASKASYKLIELLVNDFVFSFSLSAPLGTLKAKDGGTLF
jgi:hypothetical protein